MNISQKTVLVALALLLASVQAGAQEDVAPETPQIVLDNFDRGSPRRSVEGLLLATNNSDYETASEYLDFAQPSRRSQ